MQDRYAGDIGDYVKLAILRALSPGMSLGVAWWRYPDEVHNDDGRHVDYLRQPAKWRDRDVSAFDHLKAMVDSGIRRIAGLQSSDLLPNAVFCDEQIPTAGTSRTRHAERAAWFQRQLDAVAHCDLVFLDPDNGLEPKGFSLGALRAGKSVALSELERLQQPGRSLVVYHHQTRMSGGRERELEYWADRLRAAGFVQVDAIRASPYSSRFFFLLDGSSELRARGENLCNHWAGQLTWHPNLGTRIGVETESVKSTLFESELTSEVCSRNATALLTAAAAEHDLARRGQLIDEASEWHRQALALRKRSGGTAKARIEATSELDDRGAAERTDAF